MVGKENEQQFKPWVWHLAGWVKAHSPVLSLCSPIYVLILDWLVRRARQGEVKIILHRIISVVWLTNFPSEIRRPTSPRWWASASFSWAWKGAGTNSTVGNCALMIACLCLVQWQRKRCRLSGCCILKWGSSGSFSYNLLMDVTVSGGKSLKWSHSSSLWWWFVN